MESICVRSLSVYTEISPPEGSCMTCSVSSVTKIPVQPTCRSLKHLHVDII